jgi:regulator of protease activity HflC (stomatin/prohibitin superfamily)
MAMAQITHFPLLWHVRGEASSQLLVYRGGTLRRSGRGLALWFNPLSTNLAEVPLDDQELSYLFHGRSADFQDVVVQGVITYRVTDAEAMAERIDFSLDLASGHWARTPIDQIGDRLTQLAGQHVQAIITRTDLATLLRDGVDVLRTAIGDGLASDSRLGEMGLAIVSVRVAAVQPDATVEKALQTPARELIQQAADEATFSRRAQAVDKERAIAENELANRIELARREAALVEQEGANKRRLAEEEAAAAEIGARSRADIVRVVDGARLEIEKAKLDAYGKLPAGVLMALAAREFAGKIEGIEHLNVTPDLLATLLTDLAEAGTKRLATGAGEA